MLAGMAPAALKTYQEERHSYQVSMVEMIKTTLKEVEDGMAKKNVQLEKEVAKASETKTVRSAAVSAAQADLAAKVDAVKSTQAALDESLVAVKGAKLSVKDALNKQSAGDAEINMVSQNKEVLEKCKANAFGPLNDGSITDSEAKKALSSVGSISKQFDLEKLMVQAALEGLKQRPAERSTFLVTSVKQMEDRFNSLINGFADELSRGEPGKQERAATVTAAESAQADAIAKANAAKAAVAAAQTAKQEAVTALKAAKKSLAHYYPDMKKLMEACDNGPKDLKTFQDTVMADFQVLETLAPPPPVAEEAAQDAPVELPAAGGE